jgi:hypothetical protein
VESEKRINTFLSAKKAVVKVKEEDKWQISLVYRQK